MRTPEEVKTEIAALIACKAWAPHYTIFGEDNWRNIDYQIEFLKGKWDTSSDEFFELDFDEQDAINEAESWRNGDSNESPSSGWDTFKRKAGK